MKKILSVAARAFAHNNCGGNPVTVFFLPAASKNEVPTPHLRSSLARTCAWESVIVHMEDGEDSSSIEKGAQNMDASKPIFFFYMPSGEEVSYCAHAAMGASYALTKLPQWRNALETPTTHVNFVTGGGVENSALIENKDVELGMENDLKEMMIGDDPSSLSRIASLLDQVGLNMDDIDDNQGLPFLNSSVARYKTLIPLKSEEILQKALNPKDPNEFKILCDAIDSTGLYLYANIKSNNVYECRQFPRASGYPEDPATGIAAAALASSLQRSGIINVDDSNFVMYQGTAMGKKSRLNVRINKDFVYCSGTVEIDEETYISIDE